MIWMWTSCAGNEPWAMEKNNGYTYAAPLKVWASIIIHLWIFCGCVFLNSLLQKPDSFPVRPWESCQAGSLLRCRFFFRCHLPSCHVLKRSVDLRCKAKVFVLLPAWRSNAIWANAACVGHPQNLEALRASGADVKAGAKGHQKSNAFCSKKRKCGFVMSVDMSKHI